MRNGGGSEKNKRTVFRLHGRWNKTRKKAHRKVPFGKRIVDLHFVGQNGQSKGSLEACREEKRWRTRSAKVERELLFSWAAAIGRNRSNPEKWLVSAGERALLGVSVERQLSYQTGGVKPFYTFPRGLGFSRSERAVSHEGGGKKTSPDKEKLRNPLGKEELLGFVAKCPK